jgi:hypothetical protein
MEIFFNVMYWYSTFQEYNFSAQNVAVFEKITAINGRAVFSPQMNTVH